MINFQLDEVKHLNSFFSFFCKHKCQKTIAGKSSYKNNSWPWGIVESSGQITTPFGIFYLFFNFRSDVPPVAIVEEEDTVKVSD